MALPDNPISRNEQYLSAIAGQDVELPDYPITREEQYLDYIANNGGGGGLTPEQESKLDAALVAPDTAPTEKEIVGVGTANEQIMFKVGEGLSIDGSASPFTLKASGGGGGWDAGVDIDHPSGFETYTVKLYRNTSQKLACVMGRIKFSSAVTTSGTKIANTVLPHPLIATDTALPIGCGMVGGNMFIIEIRGYSSDNLGGMYIIPTSQIASGTYVTLFGMYPYR